MTQQQKTTEQQKKWVVVNPTGEALFFETKAECDQLLNAEAEVCAPDVEAEHRGVPFETVIAERRQRRELRQGVAHRVEEFRRSARNGELEEKDFPKDLLQDGIDPMIQPILNRDRGYSPPLKVVSVRQFQGPVFDGHGIDVHLCGRAFQAHGPFRLTDERFTYNENNLEITEVDGGPPEETGVLSREIDLQPTLSCYLDDDWLFPEMAAYALRCPGHNFADTHYDGYVPFVLELLGDLQAALRRRWPNLPAGAVASYWASQQVRNHITSILYDFARSPQAKEFMRSLSPADRYVEKLAEVGISFAERRIAEYIHGLIPIERAEFTVGGSGQNGTPEESAATESREDGDASTLRGVRRSEWLDSKLEGKHSDVDLGAQGKISYNTIMGWRAGRSTRKTTRRGLCDALTKLGIKCEFKEVPE